MNPNATSGYVNENSYKLEEANLQCINNAFPARPLFYSRNSDGAWIVQYKEKTKRDIDTVQINQKLNDVEFEEQLSINQKIPKRQILKVSENEENTENSQVGLLDGFYLMQLCCIEDPSDVVSLNLNGKDLIKIREEDMVLFDNIVDINANENYLSLECFRSFPRLQKLSLVCNNISTISLKNKDFHYLQNLDLSFNHLNSEDLACLGILSNVKCLKLTGNNLCYLPETFSKPYVIKNEKKQKVSNEKFPKLEELYLDKNNFDEQNLFNILAVLKKLKKLHLNDNKISCIPQLKITSQNLVVQEFSKSYHKRKTTKKNTKDEQYPKEFLPHSPESPFHNLTQSEKANKKFGTESKQNFLRNSFIPEEEESHSLDNSTTLNQTKAIEPEVNQNVINENNYSFHPPFAELTFINLANNKFVEEEDLIAFASWPLLNEIVLYGNPIILRNIGYPPLLKKFLIERLGIDIHRSKQAPPKSGITIKANKERVVSSYIPKVPKVPVDVKMIAYEPHNIETNELGFDNAFIQKEKNKIEQQALLSPIKDDSRKEKYSSFFMTQAEQDEVDENSDELNQLNGQKSIKSRPVIDEKFNGYEIFFDIENENKIKAPKDLSTCVRALRHLLDHPLVFRDTNTQLDKPQNYYKSKAKKNDDETATNKMTILEEISNVLQQAKNKQFIQEKDLNDVLNSSSKEEYILAKKLLKQVQSKYDIVRFESLEATQSQYYDTKETKDKLETIKDQFKTAK